MRKINLIVVHCSAGPAGQKAQSIISYHLAPTARGGRGWSRPGYHYIIEADGHTVAALDEGFVANGVKGHNRHSIHICYTGGIDTGRPGHPPADTRTPEQRRSILSLLRQLRSRYPDAPIVGHRDLAPKACPSFDARKEYAAL